MKPEFKILSIDGGGIRGIIPCTILKFIEEQTGNHISDMFNMVAGTSTGGIISLGLTKPDQYGNNAFSAADMLELYLRHGSKIFPPRPKDILSRISGSLFNKPYDTTNLEELLKEYFGDAKLGDAIIPVLITTYELQEGKPFYFSTRLAREMEKENIPYLNVARSTSAAPTYFKPSLVSYGGDDMGFIDGGIFANNPSILAYCEAKELWKQETAARVDTKAAAGNSKGFDAVVTATDADLPFFMLSLGTAYTACKMKTSEVDNWRNMNWVEPLLTDVFSRSVAESTHYTMQYLMPPYKDGSKRYTRINKEIPEEASQMDDISKENLARLVDIGEEIVKENKDQLLKICEIIG